MPSGTTRVIVTGKAPDPAPQEVIKMALIQHASLGFARQRSSEGSADPGRKDHGTRDPRHDASKDTVKDKRDR